MSVLRPFFGYRPKPELVEKIASPPYDVVSSEEAGQMAEGNEMSFLHVVKPEIDLPPGTDPYAPEVYAKGRDNLTRMIGTGALIRDPDRSYYVYELQMGDHVQAGIMGAASCDEYEQGLIKKHEHTRPEKEDDRTRHVDILNANAGPVFLTYVADSDIDSIVNRVRSAKDPVCNFTAADGIRHALWVVSEPELVDETNAAFMKIPALYVADGHHRSASGIRVRSLRRDRNRNHTGQESYNFFMAVCFPHDQLTILPYNRVVTDLCGNTPDEFLALLTAQFNVMPADDPQPAQPRCFGMYLDNRWYVLTAKPGTFSEGDPVAGLDSQILSDNVLSKLMNIDDLRTDTRVSFVGGIRGAKELERLVNSGSYAVAFALYPTTLDQLMGVADAGMVMPPKSTWFEPKLRSGIVVRMLDE